jgi:23S rRNA (uracil1939-C5)-methyltransferase
MPAAASARRTAEAIDGLPFGQARELAAYRQRVAEAWPSVVITDPPRAGMHEKVVLELAKLAVSRIVYVSCNPATLARDAGLLVHQAGYRCVAAGAVNMFPHTAHVESMAVFERA